MAPVLILGIGNILLRDEGVGVRVIEAMHKLDPAALPADIEVVDGGTSGADLVDVLADRRKVIVIDAVDIDAAPGTVVRFTGDDLLAEAVALVSLHQLGLIDSLRMTRQLGCAPAEVIIFGVRPGDFSPGLELTAPVAAVIPRLIDLVLAEARR
jgi:hydrogenase maturation protease